MAKKLDAGVHREIKSLQSSGRSESVAFLLWFLQNVFRIDEDEAPDVVCDSRNDKGIDGILVDEPGSEIVLFSSKYYTSERNRTQGDNDLRNLAGAAKWFETPETVENLLKSTASDELKALVTRCDIVRKIQEGYSLKLVFISSLEFDPNAKDFLNLHENGKPSLSAWDARRINAWYHAVTKDDKVHSTFRFSISPGGRIDQTLPNDIRVVIVPLKAKEIASLDGIDDRLLFARNVRLPLGTTRVNREIRDAIATTDDHSNFVLYHNGITILCDTLEVRGKYLTISNYSVVNGCQSAITFYENREQLSDQLMVLAKVVRLGRAQEDMAREITYRSNNQNPTNMRDQRSNDRTQIQLQSEFNSRFGDKVVYLRKRGEKIDVDGAEKLDNDTAAQILLAFEAKRPENAHQKWKLFDEYYSDIFSRHLTAAKVYFAYRLYQAVEAAFSDVEDELVRTYKLSKFFMLYVIRRVLEREPLGIRMLQDPSRPIVNHEGRITQAIEQLARLLIRHFNFAVQEKKSSGYFDYKSEFKIKDRVEPMANEIIKGYETGLVLYPDASVRSLLTDKGNFPAEAFFQDSDT